MVTFADMPSEPVAFNATFPVPGSELKPSGTGTVIVGAAGSDTAAMVKRPLLVGDGKHATALGGMCSGSVVSTRAPALPGPISVPLRLSLRLALTKPSH